MKSFFIFIFIFVIGLIGYGADSYQNYIDRNKVKEEFTTVFQEAEEFYLLDNILSIEEKEKVLQTLPANTVKEKEKVIQEILKEKEEAIKNIGEYKKQKWKKDIEDQKKFNKSIQSREEAILPMMIFLVMMLCFFSPF